MKTENQYFVLDIYKNKEKVNTLKSTNTTNIYKTLARLLWAKAHDKTQKITITKSPLDNTIKATQEFTHSTQTSDIKYQYNYLFYGVEL